MEETSGEPMHRVRGPGALRPFPHVSDGHRREADTWERECRRGQGDRE